MAAIEKVALALSDPIRLQILDLLATGRGSSCCSPEHPDAPLAICSGDLLSQLDLAPSRLSYHIRELREAGLISEQKRGRWVYFSLERFAVTQYMQALHARFLGEKDPVSSCSAAPPGEP